MKKLLTKYLLLYAITIILCVTGSCITYYFAYKYHAHYTIPILTSIGTILIAFVMMRSIITRVTQPITGINPSNPDKTNAYEELYPVIDKIQAQNKQLTTQMVKLQEDSNVQDSMRREFTANVSHELKTPLTSISGYAEIIRDGLVKSSDIPKFAGRIYDEASRLITLVEDIIKLSELDEQDINTDMKEVDLYKTAKKIFSYLEPIAAKNNISMKLSGDHATINGVELIIEEMIYNLCDNAIKYNNPGGSVSVSIGQCVDGIELTVKDTGIGIPADDIDHIFERFYRVDKSHSKAIGGTGLGLSIVKHGAMFHGARLNVKSKPGKGTTIRICF